MPYNRQIPDAPIAGSMLPRPTALTVQDLLLLIQPGNNLGQNTRYKSNGFSVRLVKDS